MRSKRSLIALALSCWLLFPPPILAQQASSTSTSATSGLSFDLSSQQANISASHVLAGHGSAQINVGGHAVTVDSSSLLTPAERVAVYQVLHGGQNIQLGAAGNAIGGVVNLSSTLQNIGSLVVPNGVTVMHNFAASSNFNIAGNFLNSGSFFATSSSQSSLNAIISAQNITNFNTGLISSITSNQLAGNVPHLNLTLSAVNNIINQGTITSSGSLSLIAGNSISNLSTATNTALIQAMNNVNLQANLISNTGLIQAVTGNINISTVQNNLMNTLSINNLNGIMQASIGAININNTFSGQTITELLGGDYLSKELNVNAPGGKVDISAHNLTGALNVTASDLHVSATTPTLTLGNMNVSSDPSFFNQGDILIDEDLTFHGNDLAIIASGNITTGNNAAAIDTSSSSSKGGTILMVAGANFSVSPSSASPSLPSSGNTGDSTTTLSITGASATGGKIDLTTGTNNGINKLDSSSTAGSGGGVSLIAFAGPGGGLGSVSIPSGVTV